MIAVRSRPRARVALLVLALGACGALASIACNGGGSGDDDSGADAGTPPQLAIVAPGDSIGLAPTAAVELRVRYTTGAGEPIGSAPVSWTLLGGADGTGGSAISAATAATDAQGEAAVGFVAGAERVDVRVTAQAPGAPTVTFYVSVSASGFTELDVTTRNLGARAGAEFARIELRLWGAETVRCADLDVEAPPPSPLAPRTLAAWDATALWPSVVAEEPYTLLVWGVHAVSGAPVTVGCLDVPASALPPAHAGIEIGAIDRLLDVPPQTLATQLSLAELDAALAARGAHRPWQALACPVGSGQLLLDWLVDALSGDGALDGTTVSPTGLGAQVEALRGAAGGGGCRAATRGTQPSLDRVLTDAAQVGGWPAPAALAVLIDRRRQGFGELTVASELLAEAGAVRHTLVTARAAGVGAPTVVLAESSRPVLVASAAAARTAPGAWPLASHAFTLRTGSLLRASFDAVALAPLGLDGQAGALGTALIATVHSGPASGCTAVSALVCDALGGPTDCALAACAAVSVALDGALAAAWRTADGVGLDLRLAGAAALADLDGDLAADPIASGSWAAELTLLDGDRVDAPGTFSADLPAN